MLADQYLRPSSEKIGEYRIISTEILHKDSGTFGWGEFFHNISTFVPDLK
jgi:hypothetical protein